MTPPLSTPLDLQQLVRRRREATAWFLRMQEGPLKDAEIQQWLAWCEADPSHLRAFEEAQSLWNTMGEAAARTPMRAARVAPAEPPGFWQRLRGALAARPARPGWLAAGALALTLVASTTVVWQVRLHQVVTDQFSTAARNGPETPLPDGSTLTLGARTSVGLRFSRDRRDLTLAEGEAFFRVAHDVARPFVVDTGALAVRAVGTAFDIRRNGARVTLVVEQGVVEVRPSSPPGAIAPWRVPAGTMLSWTGTGQDMRMVRVDPESAAAWRQGRLEFVGEPLHSVVAGVNRYAGRRIVLDDAAGRMVFTGAVLVDRLDDWFRALEATFPLRTIHQADGTVRIVERQETQPARRGARPASKSAA